MLYDEEKYKAAPAVDAPAVPWRAIVLGAIDVINERGWYQGDFWHPLYDNNRLAAPVCVFGAMLAFVNENGLPQPPAVYDIDMSVAINEARARIEKAVGYRNIAFWNDAPDNTKENVLNVLGEVAHL